jgi:hypothetical protein
LATAFNLVKPGLLKAIDKNPDRQRSTALLLLCIGHAYIIYNL